jgi:hypothetical protein
MPESPDDDDTPKSIAKRIADAIWPACRDVARLTSEGLDHPLSRGVRIRLSIHRFFCKWCARYARQLDLLHDASRQFPEHLDQIEGAQLGSEVKSRLRQTMREQAEKKP